jgi:NAD(P)-dependent dehydrogenase (short-subunit alcohol dehydrogenase family)
MGEARSLDLYVVTGSSRGLGAALADQLLAPGVRLLAMARSASQGLAEAAARLGARIETCAIDLSDAPAAAARLRSWLQQQPVDRVRSATLINNAAALASPGPLEIGDDEEISRVVRVGLEAPIVLTAAFIRATRAWPVRRRVLQISSGAGRQVMPGSSSYCAVKAGLDQFARALALDEKAHGGDAVRVVSLAPGVFETDMQVRLRQSDPAVFSNRQYFVDLQERGQLLSTKAAAARVLAYLARDDFGTQAVADVRNP